MFRRRRPSDPVDRSAGATLTSHRSVESATPVAGGVSAEDLNAAGWLLPRAVASRLRLHAGPAPSTLIGTLSSPTATPVDAAGLVVGQGWSLDWWIGADDRWRMAAREPAVRQSLLGESPVVETSLRIPGGSAVHRAYGIRAPRDVGDEWVSVEVENQSSIPFATVLVVRPFVIDGLGSISSITVEPTGGGKGRDVAHLVRIDGRPSIVLPRRPARVAVGSHAAGDVVDRVTAGAAGEDLVEASCPDGLATMAFVFATAHTATLRVALPVGEIGPVAPHYPSAVPDAASVAAGWDVHRREPRLEIPDTRLGLAVERARAQIQLAHDGEVVRRDGQRCPSMEVGATDVLLGAFDLVDRPLEVGSVMARWPEKLISPPVETDIVVLGAVARHWSIHRVDAMLDLMLPHVAAAIERLDRAERQGAIIDPVLRWRAAQSLERAARMLRLSGQPAAGDALETLILRFSDGMAPPEGSAAGRLEAITRALLEGDVATIGALDSEVRGASPTGTWPGPGPSGRQIGCDLAASAGLIHAARALLVAERAEGLALLPLPVDGWYGAGVEVHDLPTELGHISYAVRWHGIRPALLWDFEPHPGGEPVLLTIPGLDPAWSTTETRGDALLAEVLPPEGLASLTVVSEHPDIDPVMRRPADEPAETPSPTIEGGTF